MKKRLALRAAFNTLVARGYKLWGSGEGRRLTARDRWNGAVETAATERRNMFRGSSMERAIASASGVYQCLAEITIVNRRGLHARASAAFVKCAEKFDAEVTVTKDGQTVGGESIVGLLMLGAGPGSTIVIVTEGPEAEEALEALTTLVEAGFHETD